MYVKKEKNVQFGKNGGKKKIISVSDKKKPFGIRIRNVLITSSTLYPLGYV